MKPCQLELGQRVSFSWNGHAGEGFVIDAAFVPLGVAQVPHYLVAMDSEEPGGPHKVIWCAETWLTPIVPLVAQAP